MNVSMYYIQQTNGISRGVFDKSSQSCLLLLVSSLLVVANLFRYRVLYGKDESWNEIGGKMKVGTR